MNTPVQDLEQQLRTHYQEEFGEPSPSTALWGTLAERLPAQEQPLSWLQRWFQAFSPARVTVTPAPRRAPVRAFAIALTLALGALLLASGVFYTTGAPGSHQRQQTQTTSSAINTSDATALLAHLLQSDARVSSLAFTQVNQTQSVNSGTVKLEKVYADANNIVLGYTIDGISLESAAGTLSPLPTITLPNQQTLKPEIGVLNQAGTQIAGLAYFRGASLESKSSQVSLNISIAVGKTTEHFQVTVPFSAGKTIKVNQSVTSNGRTITLDRVVITPSETRFYYTTSQEVAKPLNWQVSVAGKTYDMNAGYSGSSHGGGEDYTSFWAGIGFVGSSHLQDQTGTWTVRISYPTSVQEKGNWQFTFDVA